MRPFSRKHTVPADTVTTPDHAHRVVVDDGYRPDSLVVAAGVPVTVIFDRHDASACAEEVIFPEQGVRAASRLHEDVAVELPPSEPGEYEFHCAMGMLRGRLVVR